MKRCSVLSGLAHARTRRSIYHHRKIRSQPGVKLAEQLAGYKRVKRGYPDLQAHLQDLSFADRLDSPSDPLYKHQWYVVIVIVLFRSGSLPSPM